MAVSESAPLEDRPIRSLGVEEHRGWKLKRYVITLPDETIAGTVLPTVRRVLQTIEAAPSDDAAGFFIVHQGREALWLLVALWNGDILHQTTYRSALGGTPEFAMVAAGGPTMCVWELPVVAYERDVFVAHMLQSRPPQLDRYLADVMPGTVSGERTR